MTISILSIYAFVLIGLIAKKLFKDEINERSFVLLSVYFLQPLLAFWGLTTKTLNYELMRAPFLFLLFTCIGLFFAFSSAKIFFQDQKDKSIVTAGSIIGNTGNLGIPLGIAIFGEGSVIYTSLMNFANFFILYIIGVFLYSKGENSLKDSFLNIFKLPVMWATLFALIYNYLELPINDAILRSLEMGAYTAMVLQLIIFGMFLSGIKLKTLHVKLLLHVNVLKYLILPLWAIPLIAFLDLEPLMAGVLLLELSVPLAVNNINFASLYNCKPNDVTSLVFATSLIFVPYLLLITFIFKDYF